MQQNQLRSKIKIAYDKTQSRLKSVENRASIPGPVGSPGPKGPQGLHGRRGLSGDKGKYSTEVRRAVLIHFHK